MSFDPIPLQVPQLSFVPQVPLVPNPQQQAIVSMPHPATAQQMLMANVQQSQSNSNINTGFADMTSSAPDEILDEAVDELFADDPLMTEAETLDGLWDVTSAFGDDATDSIDLQDDIQLGFMLEKILE